MRSVLCLNGPNLDMLGTRQPDIYGSTGLTDLESTVIEWGQALGFEVECRQSNREAEMIELLHEAEGRAGVVLNPAALTHTSAALADAIASTSTPVVEVHLSNVRSRDRWRRRSYVSPVAAATIFGRGAEGYRAALRHLANRQAFPMQTARYGPHVDQVLDLRVVEGDVGVAIVHGGFWLDAWGRDTTESWSVDLAQHGIPTANLEYRRLGSGGGARPTMSDVVGGLRAAVRLLEVETLMIVGHSAGAHLATAAARRAGIPLRALVTVSGVLDLAEAAAARRGDGAALRFDPERTTDPLDDLPPPVPVLVAHGAEDTVVPASHSRRYFQHLGEGGRSGRLLIRDGVRHFDALDPSGPLWDEIRRQLQLWKGEG
ncbi:MAG: type II 3-dehydroquinate dehydratase, partial [Actinomycetota bacterium]